MRYLTVVSWVRNAKEKYSRTAMISGTKKRRTNTRENANAGELEYVTVIAPTALVHPEGSRR